MSTQLPTRRTRQATRSTIDENASRAVRTTSLKSGTLKTATTSNKLDQAAEKTVPSHVLRAENALTAAKRKREALGEVTNKNKNKLLDGKGDPKDALKKASSTITAARVPLGERKPSGVAAVSRHVRASSSTTEQSAEDGAKKSESIMAVDDRPVRASRRISTRAVGGSTATTSLKATATVAASSTNAASRRQVASSLKSVASTTVASRSRIVGRRPLGSAQSRGDLDADTQPAHKKRRTSSIGPEDVKSEEFQEPEIMETVVEAQADEPVEDDKRVVRAEPTVWDDLDKEDEGDPLMVSEYVNEIFQYLLQLELTSMPNPRYMDTQAELAWRMRGILTDWLIQIHGRFRLLPETLFLTINIIDRFLSSRVVSLVKLQLVGITSLFIASKYEEIMAPSIAHFLRSADGNYGEHDIREAEKYILRTLDWNMSYPNPIHFLRRASKADGYDLAVRTMAKYFIEISCLEHRLIDATPSLVAAAGIWLARLVLDKEEWNVNLVHYSGYTEEQIIPTARLMINYLLKPTRHENFFNKYASRKFMKASVFAYTWVRDRWNEGSSVDLVEELPELRLAAQARREAGTAAGQLAEEGVLIHEQ